MVNDIATIITAIVAVTGLFLSVYNFYIDRRDKIPRLAVKLYGGVHTHGQRLGPYMAFMEAANIGEKMVKITGIEIKWRNMTVFFPDGIRGDKTIPFELQPGDNAVFFYPAVDIASALKGRGGGGEEKIRARFRTAVGREFVSDPISIDIDGLANSVNGDDAI